MAHLHQSRDKSCGDDVYRSLNMRLCDDLAESIRGVLSGLNELGYRTSQPS